jgi:transcriptional regulator with GAF, ATPase, and Fis domain
MLCINCAALSESLLESELFGHERGAFTGATQTKAGLLESADGGTVFLDEVGEMPLPLQAKLLRVLEQREVMRVGSLRPRPIDVRFIAATNRDLEAEIRAGRFRQDLYFRLNGVTLSIPPLRERTCEIEPLAREFARRASVSMGRGPDVAMSVQALDLLRSYAWPGNIRELRNVVERAVLLAGGELITAPHLHLDKGRAAEPAPPPPAETPDVMATTQVIGEGAGGRLLPKRVLVRDSREREIICAALAEAAGNQTKAAQILGISRRTLVSRLAEYGVPRPRDP